MSFAIGIAVGIGVVALVGYLAWRRVLADYGTPE